MNKQVIILTGPTASGKSSLGIEYAQKYQNIEIINADSMQVYKEIPITSAQPTKEDVAKVPHKMYGFVSGKENLSVAKWIEIVNQEIHKTHENNKIPMLIGGSTMYIRCLIDGLSEIPDIESNIVNESQEILAKIGNIEFHKNLINIGAIKKDSYIIPQDTQRMLRAYCVKIQTNKSIDEWQKNKSKSVLSHYNLKKIILLPEREIIYKECDNRFLEQIKNGGIEEIKTLLLLNYDRNLSVHKSIGVREITQYIEGKLNKEEMIKSAQQNTRNYAKRQTTWLKNKFQDFQIIQMKNLSKFEEALNI